MPDIVSNNNADPPCANRSAFCQLIDGAIEVGMRLAETFAGQSVLTELPITVDGGTRDVEVEITFGRYDQFALALPWFREGRVRYSALDMRPVPIDELAIGNDLDADPLEEFPRGIFGFADRYCVICVRRHPSLDCIAVQFS